jgi:hypothetical protein
MHWRNAASRLPRAAVVVVVDAVADLELPPPQAASTRAATTAATGTQARVRWRSCTMTSSDTFPEDTTRALEAPVRALGTG